MTLWLILLLASLSACSAPSGPVMVERVMPALPSYPERPCLTWRAQGPLVGLPVDEAVLLRDWIIEQEAWRASVSEMWGIYEKH